MWALSRTIITYIKESQMILFLVLDFGAQISTFIQIRIIHRQQVTFRTDCIMVTMGRQGPDLSVIAII